MNLGENPWLNPGWAGGVSFLIVLLLFPVACDRGAPMEESSDHPLLKKREKLLPFDSNATVARVLDGDTILLTNNEKVRYIGVDTPERGRAYAREAMGTNQDLVAGRRVRVETDVQELDRYGRILAYVFAQNDEGGELFVNAELVRKGMAHVYTQPPNVKHVQTFLEAQRQARTEVVGLWTASVRSEREYLASRRSPLFHRPDCRKTKTIGRYNQIQFPRRSAAFDAGKAPCRTCEP